MSSTLISDQMRDYFKYRTGYHLWCVRKWSDKIAALNRPEIDRRLLDLERDDHDEHKWTEPEYSPYVLITWRYKCQREGIEFMLSDEVKKQLHEATFHHIKNHKHHPEYWDESATIDHLNHVNRDEPTKNMVNGVGMPLTYIAAMVADWCAMSEELSGSPKEWANKNVNIRWSFDSTQVAFIYDLIKSVWINKSKR